MSYADVIWNRACGDAPVRNLPGDRALVDMLRAHGLIMNGGVLNLVEIRAPHELDDSMAGYSYYGLKEVASLLTRAGAILAAGENLDEYERQLDEEYAAMIPSDSWLFDHFAQRLDSAPAEFACVSEY